MPRIELEYSNTKKLDKLWVFILNMFFKFSQFDELEAFKQYKVNKIIILNLFYNKLYIINLIYFIYYYYFINCIYFSIFSI